MTPAEEARFIQLWNAGTETAEITRQLGLKVTTAQSRAYRLQQRGLIQPRPRGGGYPSLRAKARHDGAPPPARAPAPAPAAPPAPTREAPAITMVAVPELREIISRFSALEARVAALEDGTRPPPAPHPRVDIKQWTVRLSQGLIEAVKAQAASEGKEPSHLVEECLWHALSERRTSTP